MQLCSSFNILWFQDFKKEKKSAALNQIKFSRYFTVGICSLNFGVSLLLLQPGWGALTAFRLWSYFPSLASLAPTTPPGLGWVSGALRPDVGETQASCFSWLLVLWAPSCCHCQSHPLTPRRQCSPSIFSVGSPSWPKPVPAPGPSSPAHAEIGQGPAAPAEQGQATFRCFLVEDLVKFP